jgi:CRISPR/Cas system-associated exonuclease Cas4 (RecB family)
VISLIAEGFMLRSAGENPGSRVSQVLRNLGGFTLLIGNTIEAVLRQYSENPRALPTLKKIHEQLHAEIPELRLKSQELLARVNFDRYENLGISENLLSSERARYPLSSGIYSELEIKSADLGWHGFVDLLTISSDVCEIRDLKAGKEKEEHIFQLLTYALLWLKDCELNPLRRPATRLIISYLKNDIEIPAPGQVDYPAIEDSIKKRTTSALMSIRSMPPKANVGVDNCSFCQVRHLCNDYWDAQQKNAPKLPIDRQSQFIDMQAIMISQRGPSSWDAKAESCWFAFNGKPSLILDQTISLRTIRQGDRVRFLNLHAAEAGDEADSATQPLRVNFGNYSEFFILPRS